MYSIGQLVMYGVHGVCTVVELEERRVDRKNARFLVLEPRDQPGSRYLVPMENPNAMAKLRPLLTAPELRALLEDPAVRQDARIPDENRRKLCYRELICGGDRLALLRMVRSLYVHKALQEAQGRKFHVCDENFLRDARRLLSGEFALVLGISPGEAGEYIREKLSAGE